jgi:hypothetical protein
MYDSYMRKYGLFVSLGTVFSILFIIWLFFGGKNYEFVGLAPLDPKTIGMYTGSIYSWNKITPVENNDNKEIYINNTPLLPEEYKKPEICTKNDIGQLISSRTMETIYGVPFNSETPDWLIHPETNEKLELQAFNSDLKIAIEYKDENHYKFPNSINKNYQEFVEENKKNRFKIDLCDKHGVYLIIVPYNVSDDKIPKFIMSHLPESVRNRIEQEGLLN